MRTFRLARALSRAHREFWGFFVPLTLLTSSCGGEGNEQGDCPPASLPPEPPPVRVRVVVPYGGNMPGFMNFLAPIGAAPTEFQRRIGGLLTAIGKGPTKLVGRAFFTTDKAGHLVGSSYEELAALVDGTKPRPYAPGLEFPPLLADAVTAVDHDSNVVTVLVTDMVQNAGEPKVLSALPETVKATLLGTGAPPAFSMYAEASHFVGNYYPAVERKPHRLEGKKGEQLIPYYIWLIGKPRQISQVAQQFLADPPERQAHVGLAYRQVAAAPLLTCLPPNTELATDGDGSIWLSEGNLEVQDASQGVVFSVGLDLRDLPAAWQDADFLRKNLRLSLPNGAATLLPKATRRLTPDERRTNTLLQPYTHVTRVRLTGLPADTSKLTLSLPAPELLAWRGEWTTAIDQPPGLTTYRLKQMLDGARQAHSVELPPVFSVSFYLVNQDQ